MGKNLFIQKHREETWNDLVPEIKEFWLVAADEIIAPLKAEIEKMKAENPYLKTMETEEFDSWSIHPARKAFLQACANAYNESLDNFIKLLEEK